MPKIQKKLNIKEFLRLPIKKQEEIMSEIAGEANKDQRDLIKKYEKQFGHSHAGQAS